MTKPVIIFCRTIAAADNVYELFTNNKSVTCRLMAKPQHFKQALSDFNSGAASVLVCGPGYEVGWSTPRQADLLFCGEWHGAHMAQAKARVIRLDSESLDEARIARSVYRGVMQRATVSAVPVFTAGHLDVLRRLVAGKRVDWPARAGNGPRRRMLHTMRHLDLIGFAQSGPEGGGGTASLTETGRLCLQEYDRINVKGNKRVVSYIHRDDPSLGGMATLTNAIDPTKDKPEKL